MRRHSLAALVALALLTDALYAFAGPGTPCIKATTSANRNFLVISTEVIERPQADQPGRIQEVTLSVFPKEPFLNNGDKLVASQTSWTDWPQWTVVLNSQNTKPFVPGCPLVLVTNDGEFLIILNTQVFPEMTALRIFRRGDHISDPTGEGPDHGIPIKDLLLSEIWPQAKQFVPQMMTDETPEWFAGSEFDFSPDSRTLTFESRGGNKSHIRLTDGSISVDRSQQAH